MGIVPNHDQIILINKEKPAVQGGGPWLCAGYVRYHLCGFCC